ncbi:hypothetical protein M426DRAFT_264270 [Hypoxylon sp. CI-4A]|nr:hypothetical protein M426DRAFT_264270 [Hypoxylon sp. CI-4A]
MLLTELDMALPDAIFDGDIKSICAQVDANQLHASHVSDPNLWRDQNETPELRVLINYLKEEIDPNQTLRHALIRVDSENKCYLRGVDSIKCVLCIKSNKSGPAIWSSMDTSESMRIEEKEFDTFFEGYLYAENGGGGIYLMLWDSEDLSGDVVWEPYNINKEGTFNGA